MISNFDNKYIRKNNIELLDCQIELIMQSLELYIYTCRFIFPRSNKSISKDENLKISLVTDTYNQILKQYNFKDSRQVENFFKNISKIS